MMKKLILFIPFFLFASINEEIISFCKKEYPQIKIIKILHTKKFPKLYKTVKFLFSPNFYMLRVVYEKFRVILALNTNYNSAPRKNKKLGTT